MRIHWITLCGIVALVSCSREPERARHTVEEYRANADLRHAEVQRCDADPGALRNTPDCVNAHMAASFEDRLRLRDAPAVGLDQGKGATK